MGSKNESNTIEKIYEKKIKCPVCENDISVKAVISRHIRVESRDTDFMINYKDPNPLFYDVWSCIKCGYSAPSTRFDKITESQKKKVLEGITAKWNSNREYPFCYDVDTAVELHQLALLNCIVKEDKNSEKAYICLKLSWLYRIKGDKANETKFSKQALNLFLKTYEKERLPVVGLDEASLMYLIGELYRRAGDNYNAIKWFSMVIVSRSAKPKIKEMAREQKELIDN